MSDILSRIETLERLAVRIGELATLSRDIVGQSAQNAAMFRMSAGVGGTSRVTQTLTFNLFDMFNTASPPISKSSGPLAGTPITLEQVSGFTNGSYATVTGETVTGTTDASGNVTFSLLVGATYRGSFPGSDRIFNGWWVANGTDPAAYYFVQGLSYFVVRESSPNSGYWYIPREFPAKNAETLAETTVEGDTQFYPSHYPPSEIIASYADYRLFPAASICLLTSLNVTDQFGTYVATWGQTAWLNSTRQPASVANGTNAACATLATVSPRLTLALNQTPYYDGGAGILRTLSPSSIRYTTACSSGANLLKPATYAVSGVTIRSIDANNTGSGTSLPFSWTLSFSTNGGPIFGTGSTTVTITE